MAYRPNWDSGRDRGFGGGDQWGLGHPREWSAVKAVLVPTIAVFLVQSLLKSAQSSGYIWMLDVFGLGSPLPLGLGTLLYPIQLITHTLLHGDLGHIFWNMLMFLIFAPMIESSLGRNSTLRLYLLGAIVSGLSQTLMQLVVSDSAGAIGASGAVSTIAAYGALMAPRRSIWIWGVVPVPAILLVGLYFINDLGAVWAVLNGAETSVAVGSHVGGALVGVAAFKWRGTITRIVDQRQRAAVQKELDKHETNRREMDRILAKIQAEGLSSLSDTERRFLHERSRDLQSKR